MRVLSENTRRFEKLRRFAAVAAVFAALAMPAEEARASEEELRSLFVRLLINPSDIELNLQYARLAEEMGLTRKALAAYERLLIQYPDNEAAQEGFYRVRGDLEPEFTDVTVDIGGRYETNARQHTHRESRPDDFAARAKVSLLDERKVMGRRWRTEGSFLGDLHEDVTDLDYGRAEVTTGPLFRLGNTLRLHTSAGASYSVLDGKELIAEAIIKVGIEGILEGALDKIEIRAAYQDIGNKYSSADGIVIDAVARMSRANVLFRNDALAAFPRLRFSEPNGGNQTTATPDRLYPGHYVQGGAHVAYYVPVFQDIVFGLTTTGYYRHYFQNVRNANDKRRDYFLAPGAQLIFKEVFGAKSSLRFEYRYEKNFSNDDFEDFENHVMGVRAVRKF